MVLHSPLYEEDGDSFISRDAYGHLCTVTNALWTPQGRAFNGVDSKLQATSALFSGVQNSSVKTIGFWCLNSTNTGYGNCICVRTGSNTNWQFYRDTSSFRLKYISSSVADTGYDFVRDRWEFIAAIINGLANQVQVFANGLLVATMARNFGAGNGGSVFSLGFDNNGVYTKSNFGEVWICNRRLTPQEINNIYLTTKWRYQ